MTPKEYLQNKYPSMKKHWNETNIDDNWVAKMMDEFANIKIEVICDSSNIQKIRATKSDAEARRIIRTLIQPE